LEYGFEHKKMEQQRKLSLILELVFWILTTIVTFGVLYQVFSNFNDFPFLLENILVIVVFITYTRYLFLWKHTIFSRSTIVRTLILVTAIPLIFYMVQSVNGFQSYLDDYGYDAFMDLLKAPLSTDRKTSLLKYIRSEFVFFSTGAIIVGVLLPIRMVISFWRTKNKTTV
jgi:cation transport ATPase